MRGPILPSLLLLALLALAPLAGAHVESFSEAKAMTIGPYNALVEPKPSPMYANRSLSMTAIFSRADTGSWVSNAPATLHVTGPNDFNASAQLRPDGTGYMVATVRTGDAGQYEARIAVEANGTTFENSTTFIVYPSLPFRVQPADETQPDPIVGEEYPLRLGFWNDSQHGLVDIGDDLAVRLEHWTDDHTQMLGATEHAMTREDVGIWRLDHVFPARGMYHIRLSSQSGGFGQDDIPTLHVYALDPMPSSGRSETPLPWLAGALAILLASVARRRR